MIMQLPCQITQTADLFTIQSTNRIIGSPQQNTSFDVYAVSYLAKIHRKRYRKFSHLRQFKTWGNLINRHEHTRALSDNQFRYAYVLSVTNLYSEPIHVIHLYRSSTPVFADAFYVHCVHAYGNDNFFLLITVSCSCQTGSRIFVKCCAWSDLILRSITHESAYKPAATIKLSSIACGTFFREPAQLE